MKLGGALGGFGALLMAFGFAIGPFMCRVPGVPCPRPTVADLAFYGGLALVVLGLARLLWAGWRGSRLSWFFAAPAAGLITWTVYELVRQGIPMPEIGFLGTMTAPTLSAGVAIAVVVVGGLRLARPSRDIGDPG
ncbi:MAG: hypothetical protein FIA92_06810 [Chloroflexi bacterium]|nr:hypothetical protein [Chloroflexota bacterium]